MKPLPITATALVSAMGRGSRETHAALAERRSGLAAVAFEGIDRGAIGRVAGVDAHALPAALARFDCRNNRLLAMALATDGFAEHVHAARQRHGAHRIAVVLGTSTSGVLSCEEAYLARPGGSGPLPDAFDHEHTQDMFSSARFVRAALGLEGPAMVISTACASSSKAFIDARQLIELGLCDAAVVGGADSLCRLTLQGFASLDLVSERPCRPFDAHRDGISIGEAAGLVLLERADATGVPAGSLALLGYGASSDGFHMSQPDPEGRGAVAAMSQALARAGLAPGDIDYINMHGTATRANDAMEAAAVHQVFGDRVPCSSTKGWTGHTLGAAGVVGALVGCTAVANDLLPGNLYVEELDPAFRADLLTDNRVGRVRRALVNAFGFGGINCSLVVGEAA